MNNGHMYTGEYTDEESPGFYSFGLTFAAFTGRVPNTQYAKDGINAIKDLVIKLKRFEIADRIIEILKQVKIQRLELKDNDAAAAVDMAIKEIKIATKT